MRTKNRFRIILFLFATLTAGASLAEKPPLIGELSNMDLQFMAEQRHSLQELAAINLGQQFSHDTARDLDLLHTLLDRHLVRNVHVR